MKQVAEATKLKVNSFNVNNLLLEKNNNNQSDKERKGSRLDALDRVEKQHQYQERRAEQTKRKRSADKPGLCHFLLTVFNLVLQTPRAGVETDGKVYMNTERRGWGRGRPNVMPCGDGMKVDSQERLLARGLGKKISCVQRKLKCYSCREAQEEVALI